MLQQEGVSYTSDMSALNKFQMSKLTGGWGAWSGMNVKIGSQAESQMHVKYVHTLAHAEILKFIFTKLLSSLIGTSAKCLQIAHVTCETNSFTYRKLTISLECFEPGLVCIKKHIVTRPFLPSNIG